jgi:2-polyprenyl-3-methyl-5-hydroxy-6-metoxy-1,4-benzoquinol methylase
MACNYCGDNNYEIIAQYTRFDNNNVLRCKKCGLVYLELKAGKTDVERFYASEYRKDPTLPVQSPEEHFNDNVTQNDAINRTDFILKNADIRGKKVLEIGSASGSLLQSLAQHGCKEAAGIEIGREFADYSRGLGLKVFSQPIEELGFKEEFDVIVSFHTLEHVFDPTLTLKSIHAALKPGGVFLGEFPNQNDWRIEIFDDEIIKRFHYDPNHLYYFSPVTLKNYLEACGFGSIRLETVERYNSLTQLRNILCVHKTVKNVDEILKKYIFPAHKSDEVRLPDTDNIAEIRFNKVFAAGVNAELMGNCLRWVAGR